MANKVIREEARKRNVKLWELAEKFNINDCNFSRKLRKEFSLEDRALAMRYIDEIAQAKKEEVAG